MYQCLTVTESYPTSPSLLLQQSEPRLSVLINAQRLPFEDTFGKLVSSYADSAQTVNEIIFTSVIIVLRQTNCLCLTAPRELQKLITPEEKSSDGS